RRQTAINKGFVQLRPAGKPEYISYDGMLGDVFQGQMGNLGQRVVLRHNNATVPPVARHHDQVTEQLHRFRGNGKIHRAVSSHLGNLHGGALVHVQGDFRILANEGSDHGWQGIAGLGMSGRNGQAALTLVAELLRNLLNAFDLTQNLSCSLEDRFSGRSKAVRWLRWRSAARVTAACPLRPLIPRPAMDRLPLRSLLNSCATCLMLSTLRRISPAVLRIASPAGVM